MTTACRRRRADRMFLAAAASIAASLAGARHAGAQQNPNDQTVFLGANDAPGQSSFNGTLNGSSAATNWLASTDTFSTAPLTDPAVRPAGSAPAAGYAYVVTGSSTGTGVLRTPTTGTAYTFAGDSLTILPFDGQANLYNTSTTIPNALDTSAALQLFGPTGQAVTVNNLILGNGGAVISESGATSLNGTLALLPAGTTLDGVTTTVSGGIVDVNNSGGITVNSTLTGAGQLRLVSAYRGSQSNSTITLNASSGTNTDGTSTFTGGGGDRQHGQPVGDGQPDLRQPGLGDDAGVGHVHAPVDQPGRPAVGPRADVRQHDRPDVGRRQCPAVERQLRLHRDRFIRQHRHGHAGGGRDGDRGGQRAGRRRGGRGAHADRGRGQQLRGRGRGAVGRVDRSRDVGRRRRRGHPRPAGGDDHAGPVPRPSQRRAGRDRRHLLPDRVKRQVGLRRPWTRPAWPPGPCTTCRPICRRRTSAWPKSGPGTALLSGSNAYTGTTLVGGGTLRLGNANALAGTSNLYFGANGQPNGTLDLNGYSVTLRAPNGGSNGGVITNTSPTPATATLVPTTSTNGLQGGGYFGAITGNLSVVVNYPADFSTALSLGSATNTYTGTTNLASGVLSINSAGGSARHRPDDLRRRCPATGQRDGRRPRPPSARPEPELPHRTRRHDHVRRRRLEQPRRRVGRRRPEPQHRRHARAGHGQHLHRADDRHQRHAAGGRPPGPGRHVGRQRLLPPAEHRHQRRRRRRRGLAGERRDRDRRPGRGRPRRGHRSGWT